MGLKGQTRSFDLAQFGVDFGLGDLAIGCEVDEIFFSDPKGFDLLLELASKQSLRVGRIHEVTQELGLNVTERVAAERVRTDRLLSIGDQLAEFRRDKATLARLERLRHDYQDIHPQDESFAIFLWLRNLPNVDATKYSLRLVATSAYPMSKPVSLGFNEIKIEVASPHSAGRALAKGNAVIWNVPPEASNGIWGGVVTAPVRILEEVRFSESSIPDKIEVPTAVGAVSVYSTHVFDEPNKVFPPDRHVSIFGALSIDQKQKLMLCLEMNARKFLTNLGQPVIDALPNPET